MATDRDIRQYHAGDSIMTEGEPGRETFMDLSTL